MPLASLSDRAVLRLRIAILVVAFALRIPLCSESLWFDEYYVTKHTIGTLALLAKSLYSDIHPPAYYTFMWAWTNVFGDSELAVRTPPLLCGLASILLVEKVGAAFAGRGAGLVAATLLAVSPIHLWYSTEARPYSAQIALVLLIVLAYGALQERGRARGWALTYGVALFLLVFTHYYMAAYALAFGALAVMTRSPHRRAIVAWSAFALLAMAGYVGVKLALSEFRTETGYLRAFTPRELWLLLGDWFLCGRVLVPEGQAASEPWRHAALLGFQLTGIVVFVCGALALVRTRTTPPGWHVLAHLAWLPAFLLVLTAIGRDRTYIERSALPAYPFFVLVLATGLAALGPKRAVVWAFAVLQGVTTVAFFAERDLHTVYRPNPDWRAAAQWLGANIDAGHAGTLVFTPDVSPDVLAYYDERIQQAKTLVPNEASLASLLGAIDRRFGASFPGPQLRRFVEHMNAEFEATKRHRAEVARMLIHHWDARDPRAETARDQPFYVITQGDYEHGKTTELLRDPALEEVERKEWRWLRGYELRYVPPK